MDFIFKYAWFILGAFSVVQLLSLPSRVNSLVTQTGENSESVRAFLIGLAIYMIVPYFVLGSIQFLGGFESAFYVFFAPLDDPFVLLALGFMVVWWTVGAYYVYFRDGAQALRRYQVIRGIGAGSETGVKVVFALGIAGGLFGLIIAHFVFSQPPF